MWDDTLKKYMLYQRMLKPAAMGLYKATGGAVHRYEGLYHCKDVNPYYGYGKVRDITRWTALEGPLTQKALENFHSALSLMNFLRRDDEKPQVSP